jgi:2-hydroxychromene-2-carboxylate isomerase
MINFLFDFASNTNYLYYRNIKKIYDKIKLILNLHQYTLMYKN